MEQSKNKKISVFLQKYISFLAFAILFVLFSVTVPSMFLAPSNLLTFIGASMDLLIVALGATFIGLLGSIDLSAGSFLALCGVIAAKVYEASASLPLALLAACGLAIVAYTVMGLLHVSLKVPTFIVTLGFLSIARAAATLISSGTNTSIPYDSAFKSILGLRPGLLIVGFGMFIICLIIDKFTVFGRYTKLVGGDETVAKLSGVNVSKIKVSVYAFAGFLTGLGSCVAAARMGSGSPSVGEGFELTVISAVVLGGTSQRGGIGGVVGTLVGALTLRMLSNGLVLWGLSSEIQKIVTGAILILAVFVSQERSKNMVVK